MNESNKIEFNSRIFDIVKQFISIILLLVAIIGNYIYRDYNVFFRIIAVIFIVLISVYLFSTTKQGKLIIQFGRESQVELRKVTWPTYQESLYATLIVIVVTVFMSILFWGLDTLLVRVISFGLRL